MNKRQKIIVSITGITLVLLILVGLTYAYFLTRIQGNTNTKSISVTTADLRILYADGNTNIITKNKIVPGTIIGEKDFTVTNEGNSATDYSVIIDDIIITNVTSGNATTFSSNDFVYTLTCVSKNKNTNEVSGTCDGVANESTLPLVDESILVSNNIAENIRHEYTLTVTYKETNEDQSADMNKKLEAKVDITSSQTWNNATSGSLLYSIKRDNTDSSNQPVMLNETGLGSTQDDYGTSYYFTGNVNNNFVNFSGMCWRIVRVQGDGGIKITLADRDHECNNVSYSTSNANSALIAPATQLFPYDNGEVWDLSNASNYNEFNNMMSGPNMYLFKTLNAWLNGGNYEYYLTTDGEFFNANPTIGTFTKRIDDTKLATTEWCIDKSLNLGDETFTYIYGVDNRLFKDNSPSLRCNFTGINNSSAEKYSSKIGTLTADEVAFAGGKTAGETEYENGYNPSLSHYLSNNVSSNMAYWTLSPYYFIEADPNEFVDDEEYYVQDFGSVFVYNGYYDQDAYNYINYTNQLPFYFSFRPTVVLKNSVTISSGNGTQANPYVIN